MRTVSPGRVTRAIRRTVALEIFASPRFCCEAAQAATQPVFWAPAYDAVSASSAARANRVTRDLSAIFCPPCRRRLVSDVFYLSDGRPRPAQAGQGDRPTQRSGYGKIHLSIREE